jgi:hypothetical protein
VKGSAESEKGSSGLNCFRPELFRPMWYYMRFVALILDIESIEVKKLPSFLLINHNPSLMCWRRC